jgi:hypothetical protein
MHTVVDEEGEAAQQEFHVLVMRFYGIGSLAFDVNKYGTSLGKHATLTLGLTDLRIQKTNRRGEPTQGSAAFPSSTTWRLSEIRAARIFKNPWWMARVTMPYPFGLLLDVGDDSGWNLALVCAQFDSLVQAFGSRGIRINQDPRKLTPLVFRRERS